MADSALKGAMFSIEKGNIGVGTKRTTLDAITKGVKDVGDWKADIDKKRLKLKTDIGTALSAKEKIVYETWIYSSIGNAYLYGQCFSRI